MTLSSAVVVFAGLACALGLAACSSDDSAAGHAASAGAAGASGTAGAGGSAGCPAGLWAPREGQACVPAGIPPGGCDPRFIEDAELGCVPVLPAAACPDGSMPTLGKAECQPVGPASLDPDRRTCPADISVPSGSACAVVLPASACPSGQIALPGETTCRAIMECGSGIWGNIPAQLLSESSTQFVSKAYDGASGPSDGSESRPWIAIQDAIDAASAGAVIAIAEGMYNEDLEVYTRPVKLWGRCPTLVTVKGSAAAYSTLDIVEQHGTEAHGLSFTGQASLSGVGVYGADDVVLDRIQILDHGALGLLVQDFNHTASFSLTGSRLSGNHSKGLSLIGAKGTVSDSVIEGTLGNASDHLLGRGVDVQPDADTNRLSELSLSHSLISRNRDFGLVSYGSVVTIDRSVIRDTESQSDPDKIHGWGLFALVDPDLLEPSTLTVSSSLVMGNHDVGVSVEGSLANMSGVVIQDTQPGSDLRSGFGMMVGVDLATTTPGTLAMTGSLLSGNHELGLFVSGSSATVTGTIVRDTQPQVLDQTGGRGLVVQNDSDAGLRATLNMSGSLLTGHHDSGIFVSGATATIEGCAVLDTHARLSDQKGGGAIAVQRYTDESKSINEGSSLTLTGSLLSNQHTTGLFVAGSTAVVKGSVIRDTLPQAADQTFGSGVAIQPSVPSHEPSEASIEGSVLSNHHEVGLVIFGSKVNVKNTVIRDTQPTASNSTYGPGVGVLADVIASRGGELSISGSLIANNVEDGAFADRSNVTMLGTMIRDTKSSAAGKYGDGFSALMNAVVSIDGSEIRNSSRAGLSIFGATISVSATLLSCNPISIDEEILDIDTTSQAPIAPIDPVLIDDGGNVCLCDQEAFSCDVVSTGLEPPKALSPLTLNLEGV